MYIKSFLLYLVASRSYFLYHNYKCDQIGRRSLQLLNMIRRHLINNEQIHIMAIPKEES